MEKLAIGLCVLLGLLALHLMFVMVPTKLYAEAKCLRAGYPVSHVTVGLEIYCSTLNGAVTVKVDHQQ